MRATSRRLFWATTLLFCVGAAAPAFANGGGGGSSGGGTGGSGGGSSSADPSMGNAPAGGVTPRRLQGGADLTTCPRGALWDRKRHACLQIRGGILPDDDMAEYAYALAKADRYDEALQVLDLLQNPETAKALNYRGYATRKLGDTDKGIGYYLRSVALDPGYTQVREYLGEAYVIKGKLDLANEQLQTIERLQGRDNEEYEDLETAIKAAHPL